jgi:hypothetical protein
MGERPDLDVYSGLFEPQRLRSIRRSRVSCTSRAAWLLVEPIVEPCHIRHPGLRRCAKSNCSGKRSDAIASIKSMTSVAARYLCQQENIGSIRAYRYAGMLVIDGSRCPTCASFVI